MKLAKYVLLALLATLSVAVLGACETRDDNYWIEDGCIKHQTCNPEDFADSFSSLDDCIGDLQENVEFYSYDANCYAAARAIIECRIKEVCGEIDSCDSVVEAAQERCP